FVSRTCGWPVASALRRSLSRLAMRIVSSRPGMPLARGLIAAFLIVGFASARANADVCVTIDETNDLFSHQDRAAALLLLARQFELAGERIVPAGCDVPYRVS